MTEEEFELIEAGMVERIAGLEATISMHTQQRADALDQAAAAAIAADGARAARDKQQAALEALRRLAQSGEVDNAPDPV